VEVKGVAAQFKPGMRVTVPWGFQEARDGIVVEIWGDPTSPTQVRVELLPHGDDEAVVLLLTPSVVRPVQVA